MFLFMLCKPFANRCWIYGGWALEITHLAHTNYHHLITAVRSVMKSRDCIKEPAAERKIKPMFTFRLSTIQDKTTTVTENYPN